MHSRGHDVVRFGIEADKDRGGCTRIAPSLQHRFSAKYPQIYGCEVVDKHGNLPVNSEVWQYGYNMRESNSTERDGRTCLATVRGFA